MVIETTNMRGYDGLKVLSFNKSGYEPFIDFLKAYAIIMVVFTHCIPTSVHNHLLGCLWIDVQVPLFLLIQVFHAYKKEKTPEIKMKKMAKRIILPFAIIQIVIFIILALFSKDSVCNLLNICILGGGGMGLVPITFGYIFNLLSFCDGHIPF